MAKKKRIEVELPEVPVLSPDTKKGIKIVLIFLVAFLSLLSLLNLAGLFGIYFDRYLGIAFGWGKYIFPIIFLVWGYILINPDKYLLKPSNYLGLCLAVISGSGLLELIYNVQHPSLTYTQDFGGGYLGSAIFIPLTRLMDNLAAFVVLLGLLIIGLLIVFNISLDELGNRVNIFRNTWLKLKTWWWSKKITRGNKYDDDSDEEDEEVIPVKIEEVEPLEKESRSKSSDSLRSESSEKEYLTIPKERKQIYKVAVPLDLLEVNGSNPVSVDIEVNSEKIRKAMENFGIDVAMDEVNVGPTVTQFTLKPADGVKLSQITNLSNDIALALAAHPIRIEAPIPGKSLVGIEVPNQKVAIVKLREVLESPSFRNNSSRLAVALGKDVSGTCQSADISKMPHCLIAGATGSGKSVCINNFILSLLYRNNPNELKLIMVDPKRVELTPYNNIPHLLTPIITETGKAINALRWAVGEMEDRLKIFNAAGKRDIDSYNKSVLVNQMPYIVVVIDELAELMMVAARDIESPIVRLAQLARASGIHLVIATQRPSTNVITGLIKANITTRLAFTVASQIDSRTIIDQAGAEKLLGCGDMLYSSADMSKPRRLQGAYVSDKEIVRVTDFWRQQGEPEYKEGITEKQKGINFPGSPFASDDDDDDPLVDEAQAAILQSGNASATFLQRRLRVGYARGARILDLLEKRGIVGPQSGSKAREILLKQEDLENNLDVREYQEDGWLNEEKESEEPKEE